MKLDSDFRPYEILCIEYKETFLYSEVIQVVPNRQWCWVRPIVLRVVPAIAPTALKHDAISTQILYDLRQGVDLLCPCCLFRVALDTEVVPLLTALGESKLQFEIDPLARLQLQGFIRRVWQANPDAF